MIENLREAVQGAQAVSRRLSRSAASVDVFGRIDAATVAAFDEEQHVVCDAFLKRFESLVSQLQDQVWPLAMEFEQEDWRGATRRAVADSMARLGLVASADEFAVAIGLRNRLAHDYPMRVDFQATRLAEARRLVPLLLDCVARAEAYFARRTKS